MFLLGLVTTWCQTRAENTAPVAASSESSVAAVVDQLDETVPPSAANSKMMSFPPDAWNTSPGFPDHFMNPSGLLLPDSNDVSHTAPSAFDSRLDKQHPLVPSATTGMSQQGSSTTPSESPIENLSSFIDNQLNQAAFVQFDVNRIDLVNFQVDGVNNFDPSVDTPVMQSTSGYANSGVNSVSQFNVGVDFYAAPNFMNGLLIHGKNVAMKIGGYVKADFIYDFDPIDSTDSFDTTQIPVGALPRTNSRFHARQSRLSFDTRWKGGHEIVKIYVEGDFFSANDNFRLRQAYGEYGRLLVGKTWTTFTDVAAAPATLDFEGSVSSVNRRQAQARYSFPICDDLLTGALSLEDTRFIIDLDPASGTSRSPSPDFVGHVRLATDLIQLQAAALYRKVGFQPTNQRIITKSAGGMNFTSVLMLTGRTKAYSQVLFGRGIGSYRSLPDAASLSADQAALLPMFGWMFGLTHEWNDLLSSNFTYAKNELDNTAGQADDSVKSTTYLAINLLAKPQDRMTVGIEYLYGTRTNKDLQSADAHRVQCAVIFDLP